VPVPTHSNPRSRSTSARSIASASRSAVSSAHVAR
jgi:hypothetical protein